MNSPGRFARAVASRKPALCSCCTLNAIDPQELRGCHDLGTILSLLPSLEELSVGAIHSNTTAEALRHSLEHTPRLTCLTASYWQDDASLLQALQGFSQLRLLSMSRFRDMSEPIDPSLEPADIQAVADIGPHLHFQPDYPPDVHQYCMVDVSCCACVQQGSGAQPEGSA